jgi:hypothetical protein
MPPLSQLFKLDPTHLKVMTFQKTAGFLVLSPLRNVFSSCSDFLLQLTPLTWQSQCEHSQGAQKMTTSPSWQHLGKARLQLPYLDTLSPLRKQPCEIFMCITCVALGSTTHTDPARLSGIWETCVYKELIKKELS